MSVEDELRWAEGHVERLERAPDWSVAREHTVGALSHLVKAVEELNGRVFPPGGEKSGAVDG